MTDLVQILVSGLTVGSVIALVAFGYNLVFATTRIVNFAQGSMLVVATSPSPSTAAACLSGAPS